MALTREQKEQTIADMQGAVSEAVSTVFVSFDGLSLEDMGELRNQLFEAGMSMRVVPKRLLRLAMQNAKLDFDPTAHEGQVAVVWGADPVAPAKVIHTFAKSNENIQLLSGVLEGSTIEFAQVEALAKLPSRQELLGQLVGVLSGPMRGFAGVLSGVPRATVYVLKAIAEKKEA